jgi:hypothetical protein
MAESHVESQCWLLCITVSLGKLLAQAIALVEDIGVLTATTRLPFPHQPLLFVFHRDSTRGEFSGAVSVVCAERWTPLMCRAESRLGKPWLSAWAKNACHVGQIADAITLYLPFVPFY